jgi:hypothetical protein
LKPKVGDDPIHAPFADEKVALPELLSNDLGTGFRVEEAMPDDLANDFLSAAVLCLGASLGADEGFGPFFTEKGQELEVALAAVAESGDDFIDRLVSTLPGDEHGKLAGNLILPGDGEGTVVAANPFFGELERDHGVVCSENYRHI